MWHRPCPSNALPTWRCRAEGVHLAARAFAAAAAAAAAAALGCLAGHCQREAHALERGWAGHRAGWANAGGHGLAAPGVGARHVHQMSADACTAPSAFRLSH